jgi:carboxymethylenebutenolidase
MMHMANKDKFVPKEAQDQIRAAFQKQPLITLHEYPDCDHAFARVGGEHFDKNAADLANQRTAEFFGKHLA